MRKSRLIPLFLISSFLASTRSAQAEVLKDDYKDATGLEQVGNYWKHGQPVPGQLLLYRSSWRDGFCFPDPRGTECLFQSITNFPLLLEIALLPRTDPRIFSNAVNSAVIDAGPTRFFAAMAEVLQQKPELKKQPRIKSLLQQSKYRHVVVDSLYITFADMLPADGKRVLSEIERELRRGTPFQGVYLKFAERYEYHNDTKLADGTVVQSQGTRSKICNLGDFVLPANRNPLFSYREDLMPEPHRAKLLSAKAGDTRIVFDNEDLSNFPTLAKNMTGERYILFQIREVYEGMPSRRPSS